MLKSLAFVALAATCDAFLLQPATRAPAVRAAMSTAAVGMPRADGLAMMAVKKPLKKPVKKVAKKVVAKKPVKKAVAKKPVKKVVAKRGGSRSLAGGQVGLLGGRPLREEIPFFLNQAGGAINDYGGGNGGVLFSPAFLVAAVAWVGILLRYVIFYGAFSE